MNAGQVLAGLGWSAVATLASGACQIAFTAVLARLVDPSAFGLMAMASVVLRLAAFFAQMGFAQSLIQRPRLDAEDTTAGLLMALALGCGLYLCVLLVAPLVALAFGTPELTSLVDVLGASLVLGAVGGLPLALLRRQARFKRVNAIEVSAFVLGFGAVGVACATHGLGVWSLVAAALAQQAVVVVLGFALARYPLVWPVRRGAFTGYWRFGSRYSVIGLLEFLFGNVDTLLIGRWFGKLELGFYNRAGALSSLPVELGVSAVNKVLFPALSGMTGDRRRLADGFQVLLLAIGLFSASMSGAVAAAASDVVALLLGPRWSAIGPIVAVLALAVPSTFMYVACGITLDSMAALGPKLKLQAAMLAVKLAALALLSSGGLVGIAWAVVGAEALRTALGMRLVGRLLDIEATRLRGVATIVAAAGVGVALAVLAGRWLGLVTGAPLPVRVALEAVSGAIALALVLRGISMRFGDFPPLARFERLRGWQQALRRSRPPRAVHP